MAEGIGGTETPINMTVHLIILEPFSLLPFLWCLYPVFTSGCATPSEESPKMRTMWSSPKEHISSISGISLSH